MDGSQTELSGVNYATYGFWAKRQQGIPAIDGRGPCRLQERGLKAAVGTAQETWSRKRGLGISYDQFKYPQKIGIHLRNTVFKARFKG